MIDAAPTLERLAVPELSIVCFRFRPPDLPLDDAALDALNKRVMEVVQSEGRAFLTNAIVGGRFALRACVLHFATTDEDLSVLLDAVIGTGGRLAGLKTPR
jgi:glutamate/tyrosine decarboxylase-like PLP-dependent enzyme